MDQLALFKSHLDAFDDLRIPFEETEPRHDLAQAENPWVRQSLSHLPLSEGTGMA